MYNNRNNLFDLLRVLFTVSVVVSHASGTVFHGEIVSANVAVDGFFMLSGFFMAKHLYNRKYENKEKLFLDYQISRIKRLFPMYTLSCLTGVLFDFVFSHDFNFSRWPAIYFLGDINGIPGFWVTWYVAALFWAGLLESAFLVWKRKISVLVIFPLTFFVLFPVMYSYHNLWLYSEPLIKGIFSAGLLKAVCALSVGTEVFYVSLYLNERKEKIRSVARKFLSATCEIIFLAGFITSFWIWFSPKNFFVYLYVPLILLVFALNEQVLFNLFDRKVFARLGKVSYAVYLTHLYLIVFAAKFEFVRKMNYVLVYVLIVLASFVVGAVFDYFGKKIVRFFRFLACK